MMRLILLVCLALAFGSANAQDSLLLRVDGMNNPLRTRFLEPITFNAASMALLGEVTHVELEGIHQRSGLKGSGLIPDGDERLLSRIQTNGVVSKEGQYAYGMAGYEKGSLSGRNGWNGLDRYRTGPYALIDTIGGTLFYESYAISGAMAFPLRSFILGVGLDYGAKNAYGMSDPRFKATVSDFKVKAGLLRPFKKYDAGMGVEVGRYSQNASSRNYQSDRKDYIFYHYGLGSYGKLFSGTTDNSAMDYSGLDLALNWFFLPASVDDGVYISGSYHHQHTEAKYGKVHPGVYTSGELELHAGYWLGETGFRHKMGGFIQRLKGTGTEYIYEKVVVDDQTQLIDYRLLTHSAKYRLQHALGGVEYLMVGNLSSSSSLSASGRLFLRDHQETYASAAAMSYRSWNSSLGLHWQQLFTKSWFAVDVGFALQNPLDDSWQGIPVNAIVRYDTEPGFMVAKQRQTTCSANVTYVKALKKSGAVKVGLSWSHSRGSYVDQTSFGFSLGYIF